MDLEQVGPGEPIFDSEAGYTLVEVVLALALVLILILSASTVVITATSRAAVLAQQQSAPLLANQAMEQVKAVTATATASLGTALVALR